MGVFLLFSPFSKLNDRLPHARGGVSAAFCRGWLMQLSSPRPWGCFYIDGVGAAKISVFPTPVGVFPSCSTMRGMGDGLPHARGGVSRARILTLGDELSSPRPWGCFPYHMRKQQAFAVFPTPVGVFPVIIWRIRLLTGLPHARGGVSVSVTPDAGWGASSPRPWGCFLNPPPFGDLGRVFPTPVGVFPLFICRFVW